MGVTFFLFAPLQMTMDCCNTKLLEYHTDQRKLERLASVEVMMPSPKDPERFSFWVITNICDLTSVFSLWVKTSPLAIFVN